MTSKKTKVLSWLLALSMVFALLPGAAFAEADAQEAVPAEFVSWDAESNTLHFLGVEGQEYALVERDTGTLDWNKAIPAQADGKVDFSDVKYATAYSVYTRLTGVEDGIAAETQCVTGLEDVQLVMGDEGCVMFGTVSVQISPADADVIYSWCRDTVVDDGNGGERHVYVPLDGTSQATHSIWEQPGTMLAVIVSTPGYDQLAVLDGIGPVYAPLFMIGNVQADSIEFSGTEGQEYAVAEKGGTPDWSHAVTPDEEGDVRIAGLSPATEYDLYTRPVGAAFDGAKYPFSTSLVSGPDLVDAPEEITVGTTLHVTSDPVLEYQWYREEEVGSEEGWSMSVLREIPGATGDTYTVTGYDADKFLEVGALLGGSLLSRTSVGYVSPLEGAPEICSWASTCVEISTEDGREYTIAKKGDSPDWSNAAQGHSAYTFTFQDLTPGTEYEIYGRAVGDTGDGVKASIATLLDSVGILYDDASITVGTVLTADPDPANADLQYQWLKAYGDSPATSIEGATGKTYTVTSDDVGALISVIVYSGTAPVGDAEAGGTVVPDAAAGPAVAPKLYSWSCDSITVYGTFYQEYIIVEKGAEPDDEMWENANWEWMREGETVTFDGLEPATVYEVYTRVMSLSGGEPSEPVKAEFVTGLYGIQMVSMNLLVGGTLEAQADPEDAEDLVYQWCEQVNTVYRNEYGDLCERIDLFPIDGATGETYTLTPDDVDKTLAVMVLKNGVELIRHEDLGPVVATAIVEFDSDGGSEVEPQTGLVYGDKVTRPADPVRDHCTFLGWYFGDEPWDFENGTITEDYLCLTAKWHRESTTGWADPTPAPADPTPTDPQPQEPQFPFVDVAADAAYREAVAYCYEKGYLEGTGEDTFSPDVPMSRAMFATVLYRIAGQPAVTGESAFSDVAAGMWYTDAILWAAENGIVQGFGDGRFGPDILINREQLVTLLHRFAQHMGVDVSVGEDTNILDYNDFFDISKWAIPAVQWAAGAGVTQDKEEYVFAPAALVSRAEVAQILMQYDKLAK